MLETAANDPAHPFHTETCFTRASLLLSLGDQTAARSTLEPLVGSEDARVAATARLRLAEIDFDLGRFAAARESLAAIRDPGDDIRGRVEYLDARLLIEEGKASEAAGVFSALATGKHPLSRDWLQRVQLGLASALASSDDPAAASDTLIAFISNNQKSPLLDTAFQQLIGLLPPGATPNDPILKQIEKWLPAAALPGGRPVPLLNGGASAAWPAARAAHLRPEPRLAEGLALAQISHPDGPAVSGLMDVSDGLARDLPRFLGPYGADISLNGDQLHPEVAAYFSARGEDPVEAAILGGEDYALLASASPERLPLVLAALPQARVIGTVSAQAGVRLNSGAVLRQGFDHFARPETT
mgnify:CR=1 FL=1